MNSTELKKAKKAVRREVLTRRDALSAQERSLRGGLVARRLLDLPEVAAARLVMAFSSFGSELPTDPLIDGLLARGVTLGLPRIVTGELEPRTWRPGEPATTAPFGALEPSGGEVVSPHTIDVVITPAVAFDRAGRRVGYGGGFYDRFFPRMREDALRAGVGFGLQLLDRDLPGGAFDLRVDVVITDEETVRCPREP